MAHLYGYLGHFNRPSVIKAGHNTVLSYQQRKRVPKASFAIPSKVGKSGAARAGRGAYPIPDAAHARNALARVSRFGSAAEKATVRRKVAARYPGIGKGRR